MAYPDSIKVWSPTDSAFKYPEDLKQIVYARHVTSIYTEVTAMQTELGAGVGGLKTSVTESAGSFDVGTSGKTWGDLKARLANLEQGVFDGVNRRVNTAGGSTIASSSSTVGLAIKTAGTGNLLEIRKSNNDLVNWFDKNGVFYGVIDGGDSGA